MKEFQYRKVQLKKCWNEENVLETAPPSAFRSPWTCNPSSIFKVCTEVYFQLTVLWTNLKGSIRCPNYPTWLFSMQRRSNLILRPSWMSELFSLSVSPTRPMLVTNGEGCKEDSWIVLLIRLIISPNSLCHSHCHSIPQTGDSHDSRHQCYSPASPKADRSCTSSLQHCIV